MSRSKITLTNFLFNLFFLLPPANAMQEIIPLLTERTQQNYCSIDIYAPDICLPAEIWQKIAEYLRCNDPALLYFIAPRYGLSLSKVHECATAINDYYRLNSANIKVWEKKLRTIKTFSTYRFFNKKSTYSTNKFLKHTLQNSIDEVNRWKTLINTGNTQLVIDIIERDNRELTEKLMLSIDNLNPNLDNLEQSIEQACEDSIDNLAKYCAKLLFYANGYYDLAKKASTINRHLATSIYFLALAGFVSVLFTLGGLSNTDTKNINSWRNSLPLISFIFFSLAVLCFIKYKQRTQLYSSQTNSFSIEELLDTWVERVKIINNLLNITLQKIR